MDTDNIYGLSEVLEQLKQVLFSRYEDMDEIHGKIRNAVNCQHYNQEISFLLREVIIEMEALVETEANIENLIDDLSLEE